MTQRGRILRDTNNGPGMVTVNGKQYSFTLERMWLSDVPPRPAMVVDVDFDSEGVPVALRAVPENLIAKEQAQQVLAGAKVHGTTIVTSLRARFGIAIAVAEALLLLAFFALPNLTVGPMAWTGWETTGLNPATMMTNDHGLLSLVCLVCLFAPVAISFLRAAWARWLYLAPLGACVVNLFAVYSGIGRQSRAAAAAVGNVFGANVVRDVGNLNQPSLAIGTYLVLLAALYLASRTFRSSPAGEPA